MFLCHAFLHKTASPWDMFSTLCWHSPAFRLILPTFLRNLLAKNLISGINDNNSFFARKHPYIFSLFYYIISYLSNFYNHKMYIQVWGILPFIKKGLGTGPAPFRFLLIQASASADACADIIFRLFFSVFLQLRM